MNEVHLLNSKQRAVDASQFSYTTGHQMSTGMSAILQAGFAAAFVARRCDVRPVAFAGVKTEGMSAL